MSDLPRGHTTLSADDRTIRAICWPGEDGGEYAVGILKCTKIVAYDECGSMSMVPWLAVFVGDEISARVPAGHVSVHYKLGEPL